MTEEGENKSNAANKWKQSVQMERESVQKRQTEGKDHFVYANERTAEAQVF